MFFGAAFIQEDVKIARTIQAIRNLRLDILFLQEANE
jgi:endonuclease/exonuclease/phosphatase family metal-dependent hydrolase